MNAIAPQALRVRLPGGALHPLPPGATAADLAASLGVDAVAAEVDGRVVDLARALPDGAGVRLLAPDDPAALEVLRHSAAHVLATAVRRLRPEAAIAFGPPVEDGFFYDFGVDRPFSPEELAEIEAEMGRVAAEAQPFVRRAVSRDEAEALFAGDALKRERLAEVPAGEEISVYRNGEFVDLCRGPHVPHTGWVAHVRLLGASGAHWRGDERGPVLQRIHGTAWFRREALDAFLERREEARRRDHRVLGPALDLFSTDARVGPGLILWHPRGSVIRQAVEDYERELIARHGYDTVHTPHLASETLFRISGHLEKFRDGMFGAMEIDGAAYRPRPMNCPGHICIYGARVRSHRDLPLRYAEFGAVYRYERSGTLHGMLRVRGFTQDDAHVFCTPDQVDGELDGLLALVDEMLRTFGYPYTVELSTRPAEALGEEAQWRAAEASLADALRRRGLAWTVDEGGGAFYGPKLDFKLIDAIGRRWQGPTVQLDFNLPERFGLEYVGPDNRPHRPVMLHRVLVGSMERFVGGLIEHYAGAFPVWLAPVQVAVLPVSDAQAEAADALVREMRAAGLRAEADARGETLGRRVRDHELRKVPYIVVLGERERETGTCAVRVRGGGGRPVSMPVAELVARVARQARERALTLDG